MSTEARPLVCILAAGEGRRMGPWAPITNKVLLPVQQKALISHIIEHFPLNTHYVVAAGFKSEHLQDYLALAHPERNIKLVNIDPYSGPNSGPGKSLLQCEPELQRPFYLVCGDSYWHKPLPQLPVNWIGASAIHPAQSPSYCTLRAQEGMVTELVDKPTDVRQFAPLVFNGQAYIEDVQCFFNGLRDPEVIHGEHQLSKGFSALVQDSQLTIVTQEDWQDAGTIEKYDRLKSQFEAFDFSKTGELFYKVNGQVIKFFADESIVHQRVRRATELRQGNENQDPLVPKITGRKTHHYAYNYEPGETLYFVNDSRVFGEFLDWCSERLWKTVDIDPEVYGRACYKFYYEKTQRRVREYFLKGRMWGREDAVLKKLRDLPWLELCCGQPTQFHGDLQFDNIIYKPKFAADLSGRRNGKNSKDQWGEFLLVDHRQNFGGLENVGDIYYDFAKLLGGIEINYSQLKQRSASCWHQHKLSIENEFEFKEILFAKARQQGLDLNKIDQLKALVWINMAPLHKAPLSEILWKKGWQSLGTQRPSEATSVTSHQEQGSLDRVYSSSHRFQNV